MTLVSIVIPTRNRRQLLPETIATVLAQRFTSWELIVVDDGSLDDTPSYLQSITDPRVRSIRLEISEGASGARNAGLALARGEFCMFLDDDDLLRGDALGMLCTALSAHPAALAASGACRLFHENGDSSRVYRPARASVRRIWREVLFGWWSNSGQNLFRTSVVREIGGFDVTLRAAEDRQLWLDVARRGVVCLVPDVVLEYRQHPHQMPKGDDVERARQLVWSRFVESLPAGQQAEGRRIRRAATLTAQAEAARARGAFLMATTRQVRALLTAPQLLLSPLLARPLWWTLKKSLLRRAVP